MHSRPTANYVLGVMLVAIVTVDSFKCSCCQRFVHVDEISDLGVFYDRSQYLITRDERKKFKTMKTSKRFLPTTIQWHHINKSSFQSAFSVIYCCFK